MKVRVNGRELDLPAGATVSSLLDILGAGRERVAVERNGLIVPKTDYEASALDEGDRVEVVQFVGGG